MIDFLQMLKPSICPRTPQSSDIPTKDFHYIRSADLVSAVDFLSWLTDPRTSLQSINSKFPTSSRTFKENLGIFFPSEFSIGLFFASCFHCFPSGPPRTPHSLPYALLISLPS
ncbi:hypothetical protein V6Z11_A10G165500 [Gossypium hirsutum]